MQELEIKWPDDCGLYAIPNGDLVSLWADCSYEDHQITSNLNQTQVTQLRDWLTEWLGENK